MKFVTNLNLNQNELQNGKFQVVASDPTTNNFEGRLIYNSTEKTIKYYDGSSWKKAIVSVVESGSASAAITVSESNGVITLTPNLATTSDHGVMSYQDKTKLDDATADATAGKLVIRDGSANFKAATPTDAAHVATKGYVDAARQGLDVKQSVRAATTASVNLSTDLEDGDLLDGVTLATGDRILVKDQGGSGVAHVDNGIYVVQASGAPVRASDSNGTADTGELSPGTFTFVEEGTENSDKGFVISTNGAITVGSTAIAWTQFSGAGAFTAGDGLSQSGNTINVNVVSDRTAITGDAVDIASTYVGQSSITTLGTITTGTWAATDVAVEHGGTGASTESGARTNLASASSEATGRTTSTPSLARVAKQGCAASIGDVSTTTVTHNFNTTDVLIQVYEVSSGATVIGDTTRANSNSVSVVLNGTISANDYTIVVTG